MKGKVAMSKEDNLVSHNVSHILPYDGKKLA